eukprot:COSAG06_NODE_2070_length_7666_cov_135.939078_2_plen_243_part_00
MTDLSSFRRRVKEALSAEEPGGPPLRTSLKALLKRGESERNNGSGDDDESSDDDDGASTGTGSTRTGATETTEDEDDNGSVHYDAVSHRSSSSSSSESSGGGFGGGGGEWQPGALLAGIGSALLPHSDTHTPTLTHSHSCWLCVGWIDQSLSSIWRRRRNAPESKAVQRRRSDAAMRLRKGYDKRTAVLATRTGDGGGRSSQQVLSIELNTSMLGFLLSLPRYILCSFSSSSQRSTATATTA